jgi:hypothetical protein
MSSAREQCYERRDAFYRCAADSAAAPASASSSAAAAASAPPPPAASCAEARALFEASCPRKWVKYWDERVKRGQPLKTPGS